MNRLLAIDPGAERCGWAIITLGDKPQLIASGIYGLKREDGEPFQDYKLRLVAYWAVKAPALLYDHRPVKLVTETVPAVGGGNFIAATQSELAKTVAVILQAFAYARALTVVQIGATTIKSRVAGNKSATKPKVRNAVIEAFPELEEELRAETTGKKPVWDRSDAIAAGLAEILGKK